MLRRVFARLAWLEDWLGPLAILIYILIVVYAKA